MTRADGDDEQAGTANAQGDQKLSESPAEEAFFDEEGDEEGEGALKIPAAPEPKVKPMRVDPTPSEEFFGESLSKMLEEIDEKE